MVSSICIHAPIKNTSGSGKKAWRKIDQWALIQGDSLDMSLLEGLSHAFCTLFLLCWITKRAKGLLGAKRALVLTLVKGISNGPSHAIPFSNRHGKPLVSIEFGPLTCVEGGKRYRILHQMWEGRFYGGWSLYLTENRKLRPATSFLGGWDFFLTETEASVTLQRLIAGCVHRSTWLLSHTFSPLYYGYMFLWNS